MSMDSEFWPDSEQEFLVNFLVDARGGSMTGSRGSGLKMTIPPLAVTEPVQVSCRQLRQEDVLWPPPLQEGEGLACRLLQLTPTLLMLPVTIQLQHFTPVNKSREIFVLKSSTGESWEVHNDTTSDPNDKSIVNIDLTALPQYIAVVNRPRQEVKELGPGGGTLGPGSCTLASSPGPGGGTLVSSPGPGVGILESSLRPSCTFPQQALAKETVIGMSVVAVPIDPTMSSIVTLHPKRKKFHKPIKISIPFSVDKAPKDTLVTEGYNKCNQNYSSKGRNGILSTDGKNGVPHTDEKNGITATDGRNSVPATDRRNGVSNTNGKNGIPSTDGTDGQIGINAFGKNDKLDIYSTVDPHHRYNNAYRALLGNQPPKFSNNSPPLSLNSFNGKNNSSKSPDSSSTKLPKNNSIHSPNLSPKSPTNSIKFTNNFAKSPKVFPKFKNKNNKQTTNLWKTSNISPNVSKKSNKSSTATYMVGENESPSQSPTFNMKLFLQTPSMDKKFKFGEEKEGIKFNGSNICGNAMSEAVQGIGRCADIWEHSMLTQLVVADQIIDKINKVANQQQQNDTHPPFLLLCSMSGPGVRSTWEDVTSSTHFTFSPSMVHFSTRLSASYWIVKNHTREDPIPSMEKLYRRIIRAPYLVTLELFWRPLDKNTSLDHAEVELRYLMATQGERVVEDTLEQQEHFSQIIKSHVMEVADQSEIVITVKGNIQVVNGRSKLYFNPFIENRTTLRVKRYSQNIQAVGSLQIFCSEKSAYTAPLILPIGTCHRLHTTNSIQYFTK